MPNLTIPATIAPEGEFIFGSLEARPSPSGQTQKLSFILSRSCGLPKLSFPPGTTSVEVDVHLKTQAQPASCAACAGYPEGQACYCPPEQRRNRSEAAVVATHPPQRHVVDMTAAGAEGSDLCVRVCPVDGQQHANAPPC